MGFSIFLPYALAIIAAIIVVALIQPRFRKK